MSYSTLYQVFKTTVRPVAEYRNGHGTGPAIWGELREGYLGQKRFGYGQNDDWLWALARTKLVPLSLRACHVITFDYALIKPEHAQVMAELIAEGGAMLSREYVNHFPAIAEDIASHKFDRRALGLAINCTSVSDLWEEWVRGHGREPFDAYAYITNPVTLSTVTPPTDLRTKLGEGE